MTLGVSRRHEILYNLGIQLLFSGRPVVAFDCLVEAVQIYHTNPRLWLRLAECCIVAFQLVGYIFCYHEPKTSYIYSVIWIRNNILILNRFLDRELYSAAGAIFQELVAFSWQSLQNG